jgi:hypothetical protein
MTPMLPSIDIALASTWRLEPLNFGGVMLARDPEFVDFVARQLPRAGQVRWSLDAAARERPEGDELRSILLTMARHDPRECYWP